MPYAVRWEVSRMEAWRQWMAALGAIATVIASVSVDATANWGLARIFKRELNGLTVLGEIRWAMWPRALA